MGVEEGERDGQEGPEPGHIGRNTDTEQPHRNPLRALHALETTRRLRAAKDLDLPVLSPRRPRASHALQRHPQRPGAHHALRRGRITRLHRDRRD